MKNLTIEQAAKIVGQWHIADITANATQNIAAAVLSQQVMSAATRGKNAKL